MKHWLIVHVTGTWNMEREHGTGYGRSWNCCDRRTCFVVIWKHFCFILSTGTKIRIDSVMRPRSSSRGAIQVPQLQLQLKSYQKRRVTCESRNIQSLVTHGSDVDCWQRIHVALCVRAGCQMRAASCSSRKWSPAMLARTISTPLYVRLIFSRGFCVWVSVKIFLVLGSLSA